MKATMVSRPGKPWSCFVFTYPRALPALFFAGVLGAVGGFAEVLAAAATGARALLTASDFGLVAAFFTVAFLAGLGASRSGRLVDSFLGGFFRRGLLGATLRFAAALGGALVDQRDRFGNRDGLRRLVARDGGVDAAGGDVSAIAAVLDRDAAEASDARRAACRDRRRSGGRSDPSRSSRRSASPRG